MAKQPEIWMTCTVVLELGGESFTEVQKICYGAPRAGDTLRAMFRYLSARLDQQFKPKAEGRPNED